MSEATVRERRPLVAILGYGNELRGDDAVGALVARAVTSWELPDVSSLAVHQLTPELAAVLAETEWAIFVDAWHATGEGEPQLRPVEPSATAGLDAHTGDPGSLLALAETLYGRRPRAWQLLIPAAEFAYGAGLSSVTARGMLVALGLLRDIIRDLRRSEPCMRSV